MQRRSVLAMAAGLPLLGAVGCSGRARVGGADGDVSTLQLVEGSEPDSLSPLAAMYGLTDKIHAGLFSLTGAGELAVDLAAGPAESNAEATVWRVEVAAGNRFSTGREVSAEDVAATYRAAVDPEHASPLATHLAMLSDVHVEGSQVIFELAEPYADFAMLLTVGIAPADMIGVPGQVDQNPVGAGPYRLAQWRRGHSLTLAANEHYPTAPPVDEITVVFVADQNAVIQRAAAGEIDGAQVAPGLAAGFDQPGWEVWSARSGDVRMVTLPRADPVFTDRRVRQALNYGVNREVMVSGVLHGHGSPAHTPFTEGQGPVWNPQSRFDYDPSAAAGLLDAAGLTVDAATGMRRTTDGRDVVLPVAYFADDVLRRDLALSFASDMKALGIQVPVTAMAKAKMPEHIENSGVLFAGGDMPYVPDQHVRPLLDSQWARFDSAQPYRNPSGYANKQVDDLLAAGRAAASESEKVSVYHRLQDAYCDDPAMVALVAVDHTYLAAGLDQWIVPEPVTEPHEHGAGWGPWRTVHLWRPRR